MTAEHKANSYSRQGGRAVEIFSLIFRHLGVIIFTSAIGAGLGYLYFIKTPPVFQSNCSLHVRNETKTESIPFQGIDSGGGPLQNDRPHAVLIVSPLIVEKALQTPLDGTDTSRRLKDLPCFASLTDPAANIIARLAARPSMRNGIEIPEVIDMSYRDGDPLTSKLVLNAILETYKEYLTESHRNVSNEVLKLIEEAKSSLLNQLQQIEADYAQFREDTPLLFHGDDKASNVHKDRMGEIETARRGLLILLTDKRAQLQSITEAISHGGSREALSLMLLSMKPDVRASDAGINAPASELFRLRMEEQLMLQDLGADHPKVKSLQKKIAMTEDFFLSQSDDDEKHSPTKKGDFLKVCIDALKHEIRSIESRIMELDEFFEMERFDSKSIAAYEMRNAAFIKDIERTEALYQRILKRLDELNLLQDYGGYKTSVISPPTMGQYVAPVFAQNLLVGALCGAAVGFLLAYVAEANDRSFRSPEEVSEQLGLPIIGHIPSLTKVTPTVRTESKLDPRLVTVFAPKSRMSESYRAIRTSLYFSTRGEQHKVIQITSPNMGDGKSTLSSNLAVSIAQSGKRVLIVEADFRRPRVHDIFALDESIGICSVMSNEAELPDAIQATEIENLWGLPCGPQPNNPSELLTSRRFEELLEILREQYDFVIIDSPPLFAVTDPSAVAARVDGVILTIRLAKRTRVEALQAIELLHNHGANTLGVVINGMDKGTGYSKGYGYSYGDYQTSYTAAYGRGNTENPYYKDESDNGKSPASRVTRKVRNKA